VVRGRPESLAPGSARSPASERRARRRWLAAGSWSCGSSALSLLDLRPGVAQSDGAVEYGSVRRGISTDAEVAESLELEAAAGRRAPQARLDATVGHTLERIGIQVREEVLPFSYLFGIRLREEMVVEADLGADRMLRGHPV